nr:PREDICTED: acyl-CoA synthetase family member 4 isoform X1 [Anolis carolinensis]XP_016849521.1 PREDICTED: acyl-CoA synthetase family member 4 isoform X1 [Anolis carolinensis]|eukprot:XP_003221627.2 PREDICTED: acyl-CoA synthetase family member 4 isoform X1 [Anolis carolinensis]
MLRIPNEIFQIAARLHPERRAVCFDECNSEAPVTYTYKAVITLADELTALLRKHCEFGESLEIGLYCYPGINLPSWIIGILQVPAAYSPIDPDALPSLSAYFMKKCNFQYVLVEKDKMDKFTVTHGHLFTLNSLEMHSVGLILFQRKNSDVDINLMIEYVKDKQSPEVTNQQHVPKPFQELLDVREKHSIAYILHTSGTTGLPKIVRVPHKCIVPNILHLRDIFQITPDDIVFMASPLTFDPSVVELFIALTSGASLLIVPHLIKMLPQKLSKALFHQHRVSVLQATPTLIRRFGIQCIQSKVLSADTSLRILALGGEAFPGVNVLRSWKEKGNKTHIFNIYGITEVSCWATYYKIPEEVFSSHQFDSLVPLGAPLSGTVVEVKDTNGFTVLEGDGQVYLGGKERVCFLDEEITLPMGTMRATGDYVRVQGSEMLFLGRKDNQIKRHGKRLNIEYVEQIVEGCCQVETCAVISYQQEKLILFVVPKGHLKRRHFLKKLQQFLPSHAVPDDFLLIDSLPFTAHGKIDVSELNTIYSNYLSSRRNDAKLSEKEELWQRLQCLWKSHLNLPDDSSSITKEALFLQSGGDSLKALQFHEEVEFMLGKTVPGLLEILLSRSVGDVYEHILRTAFLGDDVKGSCTNALKRKNYENESEDTRAKQKQERLSAEVDPVGLIAVRRGNRSLSIGEPLKNQSETEQVGDNATQTTQHDVTIASNENIAEVDSVRKTSLQENPRKTFENLALSIRWKSDLQKCVDASPLVVISTSDNYPSSFVYIGSHSHIIQAIDLHSGEVKWEISLADRIESSACVSKCGNFIIVGCYNGLVYVLRSSNGQVHWTFSTEDAVKSSPTVDPSTGLIFIGSHDHHVYALDIYKEECVWKLNTEAGAVFSSPHLSVLPHHLYVATLGGLLLAVNPIMGNIIWKHVCGKPIFSSPHCNKDSVCVGCVDGNLYCFSHFGEKVWVFSSNGPIFSSPCISNCTNEVFFGSHDYYIYCCNMEGNLMWKFKTTSTVYATPFVFQSQAFGGKPFLAVVSTDGRIWILNAKTGLIEGSGKLPGEVFSSPVVCGTRILVGCRNNYVYCMDLCISENNTTA